MQEGGPGGMLIYNLFPTLAGRFTGWRPHMERASSMGFNWLFVNPVQAPGMSGSLYSIKNYRALNPALVDSDSTLSPEDQLRDAIRAAGEMGMQMMTDLVINHSAIDSPLTSEHPEWYCHDKKGQIAHPFAMDGKRKVVWGDLARFDHEGTKDPQGLYCFFRSMVEYMIGLGFRGFRCDAAYQVPGHFWRRLISDTRAAHKGLVFTAETLGCSPEQTVETARAGFDYIFNSSKWWDFKSPWLMDQYDLFREVCPSISFAESHDTERLAEEFHGSEAMLRQMYMFTALFSAGVMMPVGFEFGFRKRLHVVKTTPSDWEDTGTDLRGFIKEVNRIKTSDEIFRRDAKTQAELHGSRKKILLLAKKSGRHAALVILNLDMEKEQTFSSANIGSLSGIKGEARMSIPGKEETVVQNSLELTLGPGEGAVITGTREGKA